ncbi:DUF3006 domain-containing protein [Desulfosporosinus sp. FKA]|uniref:DUF3006 domain-containing protein n=1 Tax=Desulfosporosinus sp. FKA TaxID=1969834 RepID=UPI000B49D754|nr:DUF3006 domain-containing protein [Desulfosporosinus sp. FKA]
MAMIIDRFEGDFAVVEVDGRSMENIPKSDIPAGAREGDVLRPVNGKYEIDSEETKRLRDETAKLTQDLW